MVASGGYTGRVIEQEAKAFRQMLFGYKVYAFKEIVCSISLKIGEISWSISQVNKFTAHSLNASSTGNFVAQATAIGKNRNSGDHLYACEGLVFNAAVEDNVAQYVLNILQNIEGI